MNDTTKTLLTGFVGLLIGAAVTYLGLQKLTEKVIETGVELGGLKYSISEMKKDREGVVVELGGAQAQLESLKIEISELSQDLKDLKATDEGRLTGNLKAIESLSKEAAGLVSLRQDLDRLENRARRLVCRDGETVRTDSSGWTGASSCPSGFEVLGVNRLDVFGEPSDPQSHVNDIHCTVGGCKAFCSPSGCAIISRCCRIE